MASDNKLLVIVFLALFGFVAFAASQAPSSSCYQQIQKMQWRSCSQWFTSPYASSRNHQQQVKETTPQLLAECCGEVGKFTPTCRCDAILYMFSTYHSSRNVNQVRAKARDLPRRCQWKTPTQCHIP